MKRLRLYLLLALLCLLLPGAAWCAQDKARVVRVGWYLYPGGQTMQDGAPSGYDYDFLTELAKYTDWTYEFVRKDFRTCATMLASGEIDLLGGLFHNPERAREFAFPQQEYGHTYTTLFTAQGNKLRAYDFEAFNGMCVGIVRDTVHQRYLRTFARENGFTYSTAEFATISELHAAVRAGEVDAGLRGAYTAAEDMRVLAEFEPLPYYIATGKRNTEVLIALNRALNRLKIEQPYLEMALYKKHFAAWRGNDLTAAELELVHASRREPIPVGIIATNVPMCYWDPEKNTYMGIQMELMRAIEAKTGLRFNYVRLDLERKAPVPHLRTGYPRLVSGIVRTRNFMSDTSLLLTDTLVGTSLVMVSRRGEDFTNQPASKTIALMSGFQVATEYVAKHFPRHKILFCPTVRDCMDAVADGRADALAFLRSGVSYLLQNPHYETLEINPAFDEPVEICMAGLAAHGTLLNNVINKGLARLSQHERNVIMMNYTVMSPYPLTTADILYKYRLPLALILVLLLMVIGVLIALVIYRRRGAHRLQAVYEQEKTALRLAEQASLAKGSFMSRMSHEIRTPLNAVVGYTVIARRALAETGDTAAREQAVAVAQDSLRKSDLASRHLLSVINDVLDMSAIESGKLNIAHERFDFHDLLAALTDAFAIQARDKGIAFAINRSTPVDRALIGDKMRVNQVLANLLSNAVKFTPRGGRVTLDVSQRPETAEEAAQARTALRQATPAPNTALDPDTPGAPAFSPAHAEGNAPAEKAQSKPVGAAPQDRVHLSFVVSDTGIGMNPTALQNLWKPFEQADASIARRFGGTGLGLSIARNLVELMGGAIFVESREGAGSIFRVELGFSRCAASVPDTPAPTPETPHFAGLRVLLAEDNDMNAEIAQVILSAAGLTVDHAWNGREAVQRFAAAAPGTYSAILMDVHMPELDGYEATRVIRALKHPQAASIPILAMTADAFAENVAQALDAGMDAHIAKPIEVATLLDLLRSHIGTTPEAERQT